MQLSKVWIRNYKGSVSSPEKVAPLHSSKFGNVQGKCFHICWSFCHFRSSTSPCPEGSFLEPEITRLFGDTVGASLVRGPGCQLVVAMMCDADVCRLIPTTRLKRVFEWDVKQAPREAPDSECWGKQIYFRRDPKVDPLRIESGPSWRACFWSLHFVRCAEALQAAMCAKCQAWSYFYTNSIRGRNLELGRPVFACVIFLDFFGPKNRPFWMTGRSKSRPNDHLLDSWAGTSACDRPGIPPSPPKQRSKRRCCKESVSYFSQSLFGGVRGNVPKFEKLWRIRFQSNHFGWNNSAVNFCYFAK